jgi:hypothetical protein
VMKSYISLFMEKLIIEHYACMVYVGCVEHALN